VVKYIWQQKEWPNFKWDTNTILNALSRCNFKRGKLLGQVTSLGLKYAVEAQAEVLAAEVQETSAIEGKNLDIASVRSSVAVRLGLPDSGLSPSNRYTDGLVDVLLDATEGWERPLTTTRLHSWQAALFPTGYAGMRLVPVGAFRSESTMQVISGAIGREKVHYEAPPASDVARQVATKIEQY
jgi:Fic family protein